MNKIKMSIVLAVLLLAIPFAGIATDATDSTGNTTGTYTVFYNDGTGWGYQVVNDVFDGAQAVKETSVWQTGDVMVGKNTGGTWASPDTNYGDITTFMGKTETSEKIWNVFVYINNQWVAGSSNIGYYACFSDYYAEWKTANIALYYGASTTDVPASLNTASAENLSSITEIMYYDEDAEEYVYDESFAVTFFIKINVSDVTPSIATDGISVSDLFDGKTIVGYGSTVYLALKQALGSDVSGIDSLPGVYNSTYQYWTYNGWIDTIFGLGTEQTAGMSTPTDWTDDTYVWWMILSGATGTGDATSFVLGYYSPLSCSAASLKAVSLVYDEGNM